MGTPKASLEWHGSTLLRHAVGLVGRAVDGPVVVVRARGQDLPALPADVEVAEDERDDRGPLQGIAAGLEAVGDRAAVVFVTGVDLPLLHPVLVRHVLRSLRPEDDVALPRAHGFAQPLAAAYRTSIAARLRELIAHDRLGTRTLLHAVRVRELDERALLADAALAAVDPALDSLLNLNEPGEYESARARPAPLVTVSTSDAGARRAVRAATLAEAAAKAGVTAAEAIVSGHGAVTDPQWPLVAGDSLKFRGISS
jgi:molybdopterin-guanine dinucleotide biosynthesis protein A